MPDEPLAGPGPLDRTIIMPAPGGRAPTRHAMEASAEEAADVSSGLNPLIAAANPLLNVIPQLRRWPDHPNPAALREQLAQGIRRFETRAAAAGVAREKIIAARYALCTLIDEIAGGMPWGASGEWAQHGLLVMFHSETWGGEKFFQLLARLAENPQANLDLLELMYVCLHLGFQGRYRVVQDGPRQLDAVRQRVLQIIRAQRGEYERDLSPNWRGTPVVAHATLGRLPLWVVGAVAAVLLTVIYLGFNFSLNRASDAVAAEIAALRVTPRAPLRPAEQPRLTPFLAEEIRQGLVAVSDHADRSVVTILGDGLFRPGEAAVREGDQALLLRIADALVSVQGAVDVIGHTDNVPIRTLRFPSNWELSRARAESVMRLMAGRLPVDRLRADGRGETEPVTANDTPQGRSRNRRVEITLHVPGAEPAPDSPQPSRR